SQDRPVGRRDPLEAADRPDPWRVVRRAGDPAGAGPAQQRLRFCRRTGCRPQRPARAAGRPDLRSGQG
ncbi:hypothetical protein LTR94_038605, partial [Friedmanniomyces endolithicus]